MLKKGCQVYKDQEITKTVYIHPVILSDSIRNTKKSGGASQWGRRTALMWNL